MLLITIFLLIICLLPAAFMFAQIVQQRNDYRKFAEKQETYEKFCKRYYVRYI